jgi:hypothetical protein
LLRHPDIYCDLDPVCCSATFFKRRQGKMGIGAGSFFHETGKFIQSA